MQIVPGEAAQPVFGRGGAGVTEDAGTSRHALAEGVGKRRKRLLRHAERTQALPGERECHPAVRGIHRLVDFCRGLDLVEQGAQPGAPAGRRVEGQELVATGDRRRAGQQDVLNVVEFELGSRRSHWLCCPLVHAQAAMRQPPVRRRRATVKCAPVCVTCTALTLNRMVAGRTR